MKYTLLDLVQTIASRMDSDEINSISDSVESMQIATIIRSVYFDILNRAKLPEHYSLVTLNASGDSAKPTLMTLPSTVAELQWLKYNKETLEDTDIFMQEVVYLPLKNFLDSMYQLSETDDIVGSFEHTIGTDTFTILYTNNKAPSYYTSFDDNTILFDSYDSEVDTTLQQSKTLGYARMVIPFTMSDAFEPDLDENMFQLLLNESLSVAWAELKQTPHAKAEQSARRAWTGLQKNKVGVKGESDFSKLPHFGRK